MVVKLAGGVGKEQDRQGPDLGMGHSNDNSGGDV